MKKWLFRFIFILLILVVLVLVWLVYQQPTISPSIPSDVSAPKTGQPKQPKEPKGEPPLIAPPKTGAEGALVNGMVQAANDARFAQLPAAYASKNIYVQKPVSAALMQMIDAAQGDGIRLQVISGFRSYKDQMQIWQRKWQAGEGLGDAERVRSILQYSSLPGTSRHHWGTDVDLNSLELSYWQSEEGQRTLKWLRSNAPSFGFCEPYVGKAQGKRKGGYEDEPWHWSYRAIAKPLQQSRSSHMDEVLQQPLAGQITVQNMSTQMQQFVDSVANACQ